MFKKKLIQQWTASESSTNDTDCPDSPVFCANASPKPSTSSQEAIIIGKFTLYQSRISTCGLKLFFYNTIQL